MFVLCSTKFLTYAACLCYIRLKKSCMLAFLLSCWLAPVASTHCLKKMQTICAFITALCMVGVKVFINDKCCAFHNFHLLKKSELLINNSQFCKIQPSVDKYHFKIDN